ncbi:hypothetical protein BGW36DRAFT_352992 [Talaromyces proteolyticus]|uniref:Azaphilone pigments biosynthesis cluster protein L N-terminal domain-containing protein n=1 Tax=Talaromyces proteolyticus TaxID=1131652 RepID=A0AAD4PU44_9EURO|nr:uncharacterized protein BGW36DRAFT_352992 [Talaromyces proteolyticus]KAH8688862.1 hypothetical protein BGW36DRAFT_352992 [Talaromyces proteolyticus]
MADPLSVTASVVALAGFAFQTSKSLYQAVESFKSSKRAIRELRDEVESLTGVLETLTQIAVEYEDQLKSLKLPLLRCGKACREFEETINKCVAHAGGQRTSFRDWARLQYMGGDIADLKTTLAGYKSTINVAIGGATFRQAAVTTEVLDNYKKMIDEATSDLQEHLQIIDERMQSLLEQGRPLQTRHASEVEEIIEEKESIGQCLAICNDVSQLIERFQSRSDRIFHTSNKSPSRDSGSLSAAENLTKNMLMDFQKKLSTNQTDLKARLLELESRLKNYPRQGEAMKEQDAAILKAMREERDSLSQCLTICADASDLTATARTNVYEDVSSADNAHQLVVSTIGDLISAKHIITGSNSIQWLGQMSDDTIQKLSGDSRRIIPQNEAVQVRAEKDEFHNRYGAGHQLERRHSEQHRPPPSGSL